MLNEIESRRAPAGDGTGRQNDPPINRFEAEVSALEHEHRTADCSTAFLGSSTFARWQSIENDFRQQAACNLAFGGSTIPEINHYFDRLLTGHEPKQVVFYAGTNDIGEKLHNGQQVYQDFVGFEQRFHHKFPEAELFFVSMSVAPSRLEHKAEYNAGNKLIREYMEHKPHDHYIDVTPVMYDSHHKLNARLFQSDRLHMTQDGYDLWEPIIKNALAQKSRH
jgi:lysophospholipase L1-like esterase